MHGARQLCREAGIEIMMWGPDSLVVEAKSEERANEIASQLGRFGLKTVADQDEARAGMLTLSLNPQAVRTRIASFDISRRPGAGERGMDRKIYPANRFT